MRLFSKIAEIYLNSSFYINTSFIKLLLNQVPCAKYVPYTEQDKNLMKWYSSAS